MRYRKKPIEVEAFQWLGRYTIGIAPTWFQVALHNKDAYTLFGELNINTLEGIMTVKEGDWIIRGIEGELYSCKDSIFQKTYEKIE